MRESMSDQGFVKVAISDGIGVVKFFHPKKNSLPGNLLAELAQAILSLGGDDRARVIVLESDGEGPFCAGASFDELLAVDSLEKSKTFFMGFARLILAMKRVPKFVIVRVQGKAVGGGVGIIAAADYSVAVQAASIKLSEFALGFGPFVIGPAVERRIGKAAFTASAIETGWRDSEWCLRHGLFTEVVPDITALDQRVAALAKQLAGANPDATAELKAIAWEGTENWDQLLEERAEISGRLVLSKYAQDAITAFKKG